MKFDMDKRGVSEILGSILVFGILLALLAVIQVTAVPAQNEQIEFNHNQRVLEDMEQLGAAASRVGSSGVGESVSVEIGTDYPVRFFLLNPPPAEGALRTGGQLGITLENMTASGETFDYWNGLNKTFDTREVVYTPNYNRYKTAPTTVLAGSVLYNEFDGSGGSVQLAQSETNLMNGNRINLVLINGTLERAGPRTVPVDVSAVSQTTERVTLTAGPKGAIVVDTTLTASQWEELLESEIDDGLVTSVDPVAGQDAVRIDLAAGTAYELRISVVTLDSNPEPNPPHYITTEGLNNRTATVGNSIELTAEVRDEFNNRPDAATMPDAMDVQVVDDGAVLTTGTVPIDENGQASYVYSPRLLPDDGNVSIEFSNDIDGDTTISDLERATFDVNVELAPSVIVTNGTGNATGELVSQINPEAAGSVVLRSSSVSKTDANKAILVFENTASTDLKIKEMRISYYLTQASSQTPTVAEVNDVSTDSIDVGGTYTNISAQNLHIADRNSAGNTETITFDFFAPKTSGSGLNEHNIGNDFFIVSIQYETPGGIEVTYTYFVGLSG